MEASGGIHHYACSISCDIPNYHNGMISVCLCDHEESLHVEEDGSLPCTASGCPCIDLDVCEYCYGEGKIEIADSGRYKKCFNCNEPDYEPDYDY
jgi:hypothetical protein